MGTLWWVELILFLAVVVLGIRVMKLTQENRRLHDIVHRLEGNEEPNRRKEEEAEERGGGDAEGQS